MKTFLSALLLLLCAGSALAAPAPLPDVTIAYEKHILPNGLTLILHEDHKAPIVTANIWYHVGSKNEKPGKTGFAHLFEHLMFNGTQHYDDEFFKPLEEIGGTNLNGSTNGDRTDYYATVPTPALDRLLWMLSDQMGYLLPAVTQAKLDEQRGVVKNEKRHHENQPYGKVHQALHAALYPAGHPYSWTTIGSMEDLDRASLDDVREWFQTWYGAANAVLVVAGDIQPAEVKRKVEHYFGALSGGPVLARTQSWVPKLDGEKRVSLQDQVPQTAINIFWSVPGNSEDETTLLSLAAEVLGGGRNSRLYKRLIYQDQTATHAIAYVNDREITSQFGMHLRIKPGADRRIAEKAAMETLAQFLDKGPTAEELERVKTSRYAAFVRAVESVSGKSALLADSQIYEGRPDAYLRQLKLLREATPARVREVARRWLGPGRVVLTVDPVPERQTAPQDADRSQLPAVGPTPNVKFPEFQRARLPNGLRIVLAERHNAPVVQMNLIVDAGHAARQQSKPGVPGFTAAMLSEGTAKRDTFAIARRAEELGAALGAGCDEDSSNVSLSAISARIDGAMELFADVALRPSFPQAELERLKPRRLAAIQQSMVSPEGLAGHLLPRLVYGDSHPYSIPWMGLGTPEAIHETTTDDLRSFHRRWYRPDNSTLVVTGDITLEALTALAQRNFGGWQAPAEPLPRKSFETLPLPARPRMFLVHRSGAEQSLIQAVQLSPPRADTDHQAMFVVNNILGGNFISRLNMNLRENKHWSYGVSSGRGANVGQSTFAISAPVETPRTADAISEILRELRDLLGPRKPTAAEIRASKDSLVKSLPGGIETSGQLSAQMSYMLSYGLPDDYYDTYVDQLQKLGPPQLDAAARKLVTPQALTWLIIGDLSKIEQQVRALKLGEVKVLDAEGKVLR